MAFLLCSFTHLGQDKRYVIGNICKFKHELCKSPVHPLDDINSVLHIRQEPPKNMFALLSQCL